MRMLTKAVSLLAIVAAPAAARTDPLCTAIAAFAATPLSHPAGSEATPRSIELLWLGSWGELDNMGYECRHYGDAAGRALCHAIEPGIPQEFRTNLIFRILRCYGYRFPPYVAYHWGAWAAEIELGRGLASEVRLDVNMDHSVNRDAIRLVVLPSGYDERNHPLPSLAEPVPPPDDDGDEAAAPR